MRQYNLSGLLVIMLMLGLLVTGCVERRLTVNTKPQGGLVVLNDEEEGDDPAAVRQGLAHV